jgi:hypothetical protein
MKAQWKYAFMAGWRTRGWVTGISLLMMLVFVLIASAVSAGKLHQAVLIPFMSLGGCAIGAAAIMCVISDTVIIRRMYSAPDAYLFALTPAPSRQKLLANLLTMAVLDVVPLAALITGQVYLSLSFVGGNLWQMVMGIAGLSARDVLFVVWSALTIFAAYLLFMMLILFCITAAKSFLSNVKASGFLAFLLFLGCLYLFSLCQLLLIPFGEATVEFGVFINITLAAGAYPAYFILILAYTAGLFALTSKLMERKLNI